MEEDMRVISTLEELKVFNDPYRMQIIRTFQQSKDPLTVKGCADIMNEVPAKVHYHVQKLLKINILQLDHIEVINGINAKYYTMPKKSFTVSLKGDSSIDLYQNLAHVHNMVSRLMDEFKDAFMKSSSHAVENDLKQDKEVGLLTSNTIHLTEEEFEELSKFLTTSAEKYKENQENKREYTFFAGLAKKR